MLIQQCLTFRIWSTIAGRRSTFSDQLSFWLSFYCFMPSTGKDEPFTSQEISLTLTSYVRSSPPATRQTSYAAALSIILSPALLIIDHIHFQYNGFLYGILVLSLVTGRQQSTLLPSGLLFALLLCLKHIYLYLAPAYFVYLLRVYCLNAESILRIRFGNTISLVFGLFVVFGGVFGPFVYWQQIDQLLARLFPFARGLCHAYWAPNIWSMYSFTDRVLLLGKCLECPWSFPVLMHNRSGP